MSQSSAFVKIEGKLQLMRPNAGRVIVEPDLLKSQRIIIPDKAKDRHNATTGTVVAIGPSISEPPFQIGDKVIFSRYAGLSITISEDGAERRFQVMCHEDIAMSFQEEDSTNGKTKMDTGHAHETECTQGVIGYP